MYKLDIKPLSVNDAWQGKRFKTPKYNQYQKDLFKILPKITIPDQPYILNYEFGFSNKCSDIDNPVKQFQDTICKFYNISDAHIYRVIIDKKIVKKGCEYIKFEILHFNE